MSHVLPTYFTMHDLLIFIARANSSNILYNELEPSLLYLYLFYVLSIQLKVTEWFRRRDALCFTPRKFHPARFASPHVGLTRRMQDAAITQRGFLEHAAITTWGFLGSMPPSPDVFLGSMPPSRRAAQKMTPAFTTEDRQRHQIASNCRPWDMTVVSVFAQIMDSGTAIRSCPRISPENHW